MVTLDRRGYVPRFLERQDPFAIVVYRKASQLAQQQRLTARKIVEGIVVDIDWQACVESEDRDVSFRYKRFKEGQRLQIDGDIFFTFEGLTPLGRIVLGHAYFNRVFSIDQMPQDPNPRQIISFRYQLSDSPREGIPARRDHLLSGSFPFVTLGIIRNGRMTSIDQSNGYYQNNGNGKHSPT